MKKKIKTTIPFAAPALVLGLLLYASRPPSTATEAAESIPAPRTWVAFSADMTVTHADNHEPTIGRFWRASDGSSRLETSSPSNPNLRVIGIKNIPQQMSYTRALTGKWTSAPMQLPPRGWHPIQWRYNRPGLSEYVFKLDIERGRTGSLTAASGFRAFQYVSGRGDTALLVPELNFFAVVTQILSSGRRERYWNIERVEPDPALFEPPPDVTVTHLEKPRGIVSRPQPPEAAK